MRDRIISAIVAFMIFIPIFIIGGHLYNIAILVVACLALKEFLDMKQVKKELPVFIELISYIMLSLFVLINITNTDIVFSIDYRIVSGLFLVFMMPAVLYHDRSLYSIVDAFYLD